MKHLLSARTLALGVALSAALAVVAAAQAFTSSQARSHASTRALVALRTTALGSVLADARGRTLYRFVGDKRGGQTAGEGLDDFGAGWYALAANGSKVDKDKSESGGASGGSGSSGYGGYGG